MHPAQNIDRSEVHRGAELKSYQSNWRRKPTWSRLRLIDGQSADFLIMDDPWTYEIPSSNRDGMRVRHAVNIVLKDQLLNPAYRSCIVWEMNDQTFRNMPFDPRKHWLRVTRCGNGADDTYYEVEIVRDATDSERELAGYKHCNSLELVALESCSRKQRP